MAVILIDQQEKKPFTFGRQKTKTTHLKTGDYTLEGLEDKICIERKSLQDLASSITKQRFWNEMERMSSINKSYLLLECSSEDITKFPAGSGIPRKVWRFLKVKPPFIFSSLKKIEEKYGVEVIFSENRSEAAKKCKSILLSGVH